MINLLLFGGPGTPGMTDVIEISVSLLGILIILNGIFELIKNKSWKRLFHKHRPALPDEPTNKLHSSA